jgi:uncharacterized protein YecE (DUF72 family)
VDGDGHGRGRAWIGCSGWSYRHWLGPVYPPDLPPRRWFGTYRELFDSVEVNNTFYRLPAPQTFDRWASQAPDDFRYALKLGQFGSHRKKLTDAARWLPNHVERAERLGPALGPTLVQLPPRWRRNAERLDQFLSVAPRHLRWAVELRDPSWLHDDVYAVLARHDAALCIHDLLADHPWERTTDWVYIRFHGPHALQAPYQGQYGPDGLWWVADKINWWLGEGHDVYAYFNNDQNGYAANDARWLRDAVR